MIESNEYLVVKELEEMGASKKFIRKFIKRFAGWRIYFRKKRSEYDEIKSMYEQMIAVGSSRAEAVKYLSEIFGKSVQRIREITAIQKGLFDED